MNNNSYKQRNNNRFERPNAYNIIQNICDDYIEINGDRLYGNDPSITCGIGIMNSQILTIIGQLHGRTPHEDILYNYSMTKPEGYRKAIRSIQQANKFQRPIVCFIDTIGAFPGKNAEERGISQAIANCIQALMTARVPVISIILGNGYSGGAIALCAANKIAMLENAYFSVISPKACSEILWKTPTYISEASKILEMTSYENYNKGLIDYIIPEANGFNNISLTSQNIKKYLLTELCRYSTITVNDIILERQNKFKSIGNILELR